MADEKKELKEQLEAQVDKKIKEITAGDPVAGELF